MAVTTQNSTEYGYVTSTPVTVQDVNKAGGRIRYQEVTFTQSGAGDANSLINLVKLPPGKVTLIGNLSFLRFSAFGTGTTLDVGWTAYTNSSGTAVAADIDGLDDGIDVSAAGTMNLGTNTGVTSGDSYTFDSRDGVVIQGKAIGAGIPDAATIKGFIAYTVD